MNSVRKALLYTTADRYFSLVANFILMMIVSRILTPAEIGISVTGSAIVALALSLREFSSTSYIVQRRDLSREDVRATFTMMFALTSLISAALFLFAPPIAHIYGEEGLSPYLRLVSVAILVEVIAAPVLGLMRREMAFGHVALVGITVAVFNAASVVALTLLGYSYMSFAMAWLVSAVSGCVLALALRGEFWILKPLFSNWRGVFVFGAYNGLIATLARLYDQIPYLVLGRFFSFDAVGLFNRTLSVAQLPDKVFLASSIAVVFSRFSSEARNGGDLKGQYLAALTYTTVVHWPALAVLAILAYPIVSILYGAQWLEIVPLVQIAAISAFFSFSFALNYNALMAVGAIRDAFIRSLIVWPVCALSLLAAAPFGLRGMVLSLLVTMPFQALVSHLFVRRHIALTWLDLAQALWKSCAVTLASAAGPAAVAIASHPAHIGPAGAAIAITLSALGWVTSIWLLKHPARRELGMAAAYLVRPFLGAIARRRALPSLPRAVAQPPIGE
jgi:O-antigen/teichoic acid export membrane protein